MIGGAQAARLCQRFNETKDSPRIGGAAILRELSNLASACVVGASDARDTVAFALAEVLGLHADDRENRIVTGDDNYALMASGAEHLSAAINFIERGGGADDAVRIVAALARLTPDRIYRR